MSAPRPAISVSGLGKSFGAFQALRDVSFELASGSTTALLGPSGCGKTTILRCLAGLERPDAGVIRIGDRTVFDAAKRLALPPERRDIGVVFQSYAIWPHMTVAENIGFPLRIRHVGRSETMDRVDRVLDMVGLAAAKTKLATQLSGGQQQRVAIARALIAEPQMVLFDEALSNLDAQMREQMRLELKQLQARIGFTALYVTHDQTEAFALAEHVIVMNRGSVETAGDPRQVFDHPATPFVARFMGLNIVEGHVLSHDEGRVAFETVGGHLLDGILAAQGGGAQTPAIACVRKEHVHLALPGEMPAAGLNTLLADVVTSSFMGVHREYLLRAEGVEMKATSTRHDLEAAPRLAVSFEPAHCIVFA